MRSRKRSPKRSITRSMRAISMRSLPMPRIMTVQASCSGALLPLTLGANLVHQRPHPLDCAFEAAEDRLADEEMANIELDDRRDGGDRADGIEAEPVASMAFEPGRLGMGGGIDDALQLAARRLAARVLRPGVAEGTDMELDDRRAERHRAVERRAARLDEERHADASADELTNIGNQRVVAAHDVETALGGALLALLGNQAGG